MFIKVENARIFNWEGAILGMRNSFGSQDKSDSKWVRNYETLQFEYEVGPEDLKLMTKLAKAGSSHAKYLRQILVSCDITADTVWWAEADTYKVGTTANSTSTMHTLGKEGTVADSAFGFDNFEDPLVRKYLEEVIRPAVADWIKAGSKRGGNNYEWRRMIHLNARAFLYTRHFTCNYQVLVNMYHDRKNHRYIEWHSFCDWIRSLPHSQLITGEF